MKFLRRPDTETVLEPPAKKPREDDTHIIEHLQDEMKKRKKDRNIANIQSLTNDTFLERRSWMAEEQPLVSDVLTKFPSLTLRKVVS